MGTGGMGGEGIIHHRGTETQRIQNLEVNSGVRAHSSNRSLNGPPPSSYRQKQAMRMGHPRVKTVFHYQGNHPGPRIQHI